MHTATVQRLVLNAIMPNGMKVNIKESQEDEREERQIRCL